MVCMPYFTFVCLPDCLYMYVAYCTCTLAYINATNCHGHHSSIPDLLILDHKLKKTAPANHRLTSLQSLLSADQWNCILTTLRQELKTALWNSEILPTAYITETYITSLWSMLIHRQRGRLRAPVTVWPSWFLDVLMSPCLPGIGPTHYTAHVKTTSLKVVSSHS